MDRSGFVIMAKMTQSCQLKYFVFADSTAVVVTVYHSHLPLLFYFRAPGWRSVTKKPIGGVEL